MVASACSLVAQLQPLSGAQRRDMPDHVAGAREGRRGCALLQQAQVQLGGITTWYHIVHPGLSVGKKGGKMSQLTSRAVEFQPDEPYCNFLVSLFGNMYKCKD